MEEKKKYETGMLVSGEGIFLGLLDIPSIPDVTWNVFVAPTDLTDKDGKIVTSRPSEFINRVSSLKDWHGHSGGYFETPEMLYTKLKDGSAIGRWFVPPTLMMTSRGGDKNEVWKNNLWDNKSVGAFKESLCSGEHMKNKTVKYAILSRVDYKDYRTSTFMFNENLPFVTSILMGEEYCRPFRVTVAERRSPSAANKSACNYG